MSEFLGRDLRVNEAVDSLTALETQARGKVAAIPPRRGFTTTPDGRVLDPFGNVVYTPTPIKQERTK